MTDKPIPFSGPMIRALLDGRKTQTRRVLKQQPPEAPASAWHPAPANTAKHQAPYLDAYCGEQRTAQNPRGMSCNWHWWTVDDRPGPTVTTTQYTPGLRLWVKEDHWAVGHWEKTGGLTKMGRPKWRFVRDWGHAVAFQRPDTVAPDRAHYGWHKRLGRFMWRCDSRLTLVVTDVRVQRLQEISNDDARAEGAAHWWRESDPETRSPTTTATGMFRTLWNSIHGPDAWSENPWVCAISFDVHQCNIDQMETAND